MVRVTLYTPDLGKLVNAGVDIRPHHLRLDDVPAWPFIQFSLTGLFVVKLFNMTIGKKTPPIGHTTNVFDMDIIPGTEVMREGEGVHLANGSNHDIQ